MNAPRANGNSKAKQTALAVIEALAKLGLAPTPSNYSVWYAHLAGENPELSRLLDRHLSSGNALTTEAMDDLWRRHCLPHGDPQMVMATSQRLGSIMNEIAEQMSRAGSDTERFGGAVAKFGEGLVGALASPDAAGALRQTVGDMLLETKRMAEQNRTLEQQLKTSTVEIDTLRASLDEMRRAAVTDGLTGIGNRKAFDAALKEASAEAAQTGQPMCLVMTDVDHFKKFNDTHGHLLGDEVLKLVARVLKAGVKGRDTVARYGGEEFAVILPETSLENAWRLADQLREQLKGKKITIKSTGKDLGRVTASLGVARYRPGEAASELIARADGALYFAKRNGRDRVCDERDLAEDVAGAAA
jgi:diguanylate cyclase